MLKVTPISDIAYLTETAANAKNAVAYYTDTKSKTEPPGEWWCPNSWIVKDGDIASAIAVTRLAQGRHPKTGRKLVDGKGDQKRAAYDLTFSAPKAWTALWVVSNLEERCMLDDMLMEAVRESLDEVLESGLIEARLGKGGMTREPMKNLVAALYRHTTSREGDPQAHIHAALLNVGLRKDGQIRAINNEKLCIAHKTIGAAFRLRLAEKLESVGVPVLADINHGFIIDGQPTELVDVWSKRRQKILEAADEDGLDSTAGKLKQIDKIVKKTRGKKKDLPSMDVLEDRWRQEVALVGWTRQAEWSRLDRPPIVRSVKDESHGAVDIVRESIEMITEKQSLFEQREIESMALTLAVGRCSAMAISRALKAILASQEVVKLKQGDLFTTPVIIAEERAIMQVARSRQNEPSVGFSADALEAANADSKYSEEQREAINHALLPHGVSVVEGGPGVGKTTAAAAIKVACQRDDRRLILIAPSWSAVETLQSELNHKGPAFALDMLLSDLRAGTMALQGDDVVLVDEAGMTSTMQIYALMQAAQQAGAKLVLQGDVNQISAVNRGDPLSLICKAIGSQQIRTIRRQKIDWQRQASMVAQQGEIMRALMAYAAHGAVSIADDQDGALIAMAAAFKQVGGDAVAIAATNQKVTEINDILRRAAHEVGIISGPEIVIRALPRGRKNKPKPVDLALARGDRLILGGEAVIDGVTLRNATRLTVKDILPGGAGLILETEDGRILTTGANELANAGKGGKPIIMQHAFCLTVHAAQGATWSRTLWLPSHEDSRAALVSMTRHRDDLQVFVDRASLPNYSDASMTIERHRMADPEQPPDERNDMEIVAAMGRSMQRVTAPRNALDVMELQSPQVPKDGSILAEPIYNLEPMQ